MVTRFGRNVVNVFVGRWSAMGGIHLQSHVLLTQTSHEIEDVAVDDSSLYFVGGTPGTSEQAGFIARIARKPAAVAVDWATLRPLYTPPYKGTEHQQQPRTRRPTTTGANVARASGGR